ncbi:hypothetical protein NDU88_004412 [Pleurodeles waltl]|uniref:BHLH domain-containing protein n=1 Tax=Pleurodeles waltl TaxID=8319 RepID=A0AAV7N2X3_PLEWA|nr:hypothetical protein NDU88_004412 [Pleurodeles waltl]
MWVPEGNASEERDRYFSDAPNHRLPVVPRKREKHSNDTTTLRELGQLLPSPLQTDSKKPTKKEILLRVLCYIEYLQRSIHAARALLQVKHRGDKGKRRGERRCEKGMIRVHESFFALPLLCGTIACGQLRFSGVDQGFYAGRAPFAAPELFPKRAAPSAASHAPLVH